jgi:hypothetical protein
MRLGQRSVLFGMISAIGALALATLASAQERAGVVTTLEGKVTVARASSSEPTPLKFRDDVFVRDRIATGQNAFARILLGGKAVVTVREFSAVTITEAPGVATVDVGSGRVAVAVASERMQPGELVEVRTPNAVAGIRGTVIVAEVFDANRSVITVLKGVIDVTQLDARRAVGASTVLNALQRVTVTHAVSAPVSISKEAAQRLGAEFRAAPPSSAPTAATTAVAQGEMDRVTQDPTAGSASVAGDVSSINVKTAATNQPTKGPSSDIATVSATSTPAPTVVSTPGSTAPLPPVPPPPPVKDVKVDAPPPPPKPPKR